MKLRPTDTHGRSSFGKEKQQIFSYFLYQATGTVKEPLYRSPTLSLSLSISCSCLCCFVSFFSRCLFRMDATARSSCRVNRTNHAESRCVRAGNRERRTDASATCVFCRQTSVRTGRTRVLIIRLLKPEKGNNPGHWENFKDKRLLMMVEWKRRHGFQDTRGIPAAGATMEGARKDSRFFFLKKMPLSNVLSSLL